MFRQGRGLAFLGGLAGLIGPVGFLGSLLDGIIRDTPAGFLHPDRLKPGSDHLGFISLRACQDIEYRRDGLIVGALHFKLWAIVSTGSPSSSGLRAKCRPCNRMMLGGTPPLAIQLTNALATPNAGCLGGVVLDFTTAPLGLAAYCSGACFFSWKMCVNSV